MGRLEWEKKAFVLFLLCAATAITSSAQTFKTLHSFDLTDGFRPEGALVQATDGNFYGTTEWGGKTANPKTSNPGSGTIFKITPSGTLTTLYSFCLQPGCRDGASPQGPLVQATDRNLYGTTYAGGATGYGTVFKITLSGKLTTLFSFCSQPDCPVVATTSNGAGWVEPGGANPAGGLVQGKDGNFYGTSGGGPNLCQGGGCGTVFKITPSGTLTTLYNFCSQPGCTDGTPPQGPLIQASDGNFYGTTSGGGANLLCGLPYVIGGCGTVFKITPSGTLTTLYNFCSDSWSNMGQVGCADGFYPNGGLIQASDGNLYGTTSAGGGIPNYTSGLGTIFKITLDGTLTRLYGFCVEYPPSVNCPDGAGPGAGVIQATDGNLYGTTTGGTLGASLGTVFQFWNLAANSGYGPNSGLRTLHNFCSQPGCTDGTPPQGPLIQASDGNFYGTTVYGGASSACTGGCGTVFSLSGPGFTLSASPATLTVAPGATTGNISTITVTPTPTGLTCVPAQQCGFSGQVKLSCSVAGSSTGYPACSIPSSVTISGTTAETATLTITTTTASSALDRQRKMLFTTAGVTLAVVLFPVRRRQWMTKVGLLIVILFIGIGCGSNGESSSSKNSGTINSGTMPGTYMVTVTGTGANGKLTSSATVTVTVRGVPSSFVRRLPNNRGRL